MPPSVVRWYQAWISNFPESWHTFDLERFYMFVSVLLRVIKKERSSGWLQQNLKQDCPRLSQDDIEEYCEIYEHIKDFKNVWDTNQALLIARAEFDKRMDEARKKYGS